MIQFVCENHKEHKFGINWFAATGLIPGLVHLRSRSTSQGVSFEHGPWIHPTPHGTAHKEAIKKRVGALGFVALILPFSNESPHSEEFRPYVLVNVEPLPKESWPGWDELRN